MPRSGRFSSGQHFASHLAAVNTNNPVESAEDIVNDNGVLLVAKGARINEAARDRLLRHRLARPLHPQINLSRCLDGAGLCDASTRLWQRYPDLRQLLRGAGLEAEFERTLAGTPMPRTLWQHLTVLRQRLPGTFEKGLFCAVVAWTLARELALEPSALRGVFVAALIHDIGLLHVPEAVTFKSETLTPQEWQLIQGHVGLGHQVVVDTGSLTPPLTARAVLEHHERHDGSGYPRGADGLALHPASLIVALADGLQAVRVGALQRRGANLASAVPYLQMNAASYSAEVVRAMRLVLRRSGLRPLRADASLDIAAFAERLAQRVTHLETTRLPLERLRDTLAAAGSSDTTRALRRRTDHVVYMIRASGMLSPALQQWLQKAAAGQATAETAELETINLLLEELAWQLHDLDRALRKHRASGPMPADRLAETGETLEAALEALDWADGKVNAAT